MEKGGNNHGIVSHENFKATKSNYKIIEIKNGFHVKKKFGPFYIYIRTKGHKIFFKSFAGVVTYVLKRRREDAMQKM